MFISCSESLTFNSGYPRMALTSLEEEQSSLSRSLQVINTINCVIRELVENSIDANSTKIEIKVYNGGLDLIQVSDNGTGISESNFEMLALKHTTSKIRKFEDIFSSLTTFGFRGEALHSLCNVSTLEVDTRVESLEHGWNLKYDSLGKLISKSPVAANVGTCVRVRDLFKNYSVRRKLLTKSSKNQIAKAVSQLQQYALINPQIGFNLTTVSTNGQLSNIFTTSGAHKTVRGVIEQLFGQDFSSKLVDIQIVEEKWKIEGLISSPHSERNYRDLDYFYINKRPIGKTQKFKNAITSVFNNFSSKIKPSFILNLNIDYESVDINLSPDKRSAFLFSEDQIIRTFKERLYECLIPKKPNLSQFNSDLLMQFLSQTETQTTDRTSQKSEFSDKKEQESTGSQKRELEENSSQPSKRVEVEPTSQESTKEAEVTNKESAQEEGMTLQEYLDSSKESYRNQDCQMIEVTQEGLYGREEKVTLLCQSQEKFAECDINTEDLGDHNLLDPRVFKNMRLVGQFNNSFIITKLTFPEIKSNLNYSIYIIDQHAADEKARFEKLNKTVRINRQNLINPKLIELSPFLTQVAEQNLDLLISNGFNTTVCKENEVVMYRDKEVMMTKESQDQVAKGVYIHSFPQVLGTVLDEEDFVDFVNQLSGSERMENQEGSDIIWGSGSIQRPQKVWSILASKACKSSIRLGDPLPTGKMKNIINNLSTLIHPWNCPHGRPSIKTLISHQQLDSLFNKN